MMVAETMIFTGAMDRSFTDVKHGDQQQDHSHHSLFTTGGEAGVYA